MDQRDEAPDDLPDYLVKTYSWAYLRPSSLLIFDNPLVVGAILWGNIWRLMRAACDEFRPGQRILQAASVYGSLSATLAETVGSDGQLEVIDIAPLQVDHTRRKLAGYPQASVRVADAARPGGGRYDGICCFFLLHEIPDAYKHAVVDGLLDSAAPGAKVVFVDYHRPLPLHPLRPVMQGVFRWLEPYAEGLLCREIRDFAAERDAFTWRKETFFGGLYQKVVAQRKM
ncbi:MAG: methyltransferase domain-containing protein [Rhodospirillales bacterium]|nr:MAG: methyltransferase domain-containing protein [Rhodospirillales bacterium]